MSLMVEGVVGGGMDVEKTLRGSRRLEPLHLGLSSPHDLMGVFSSICRAVGAQLVGDQQLRCEALFLEQLAHQPQCRMRISPTLNAFRQLHLTRPHDRGLERNIQHAIWLYLRFTLSCRDVEEVLAERGLDVSDETVRRWVLQFGPLIAPKLRQGRPRPSTQ